MWIDHADGRQQAMRGVRAGVWVAIFGMGVATGAVVRTGVPAARAAQNRMDDAADGVTDKSGDLDHERSKVLLLVHADTWAARQSVQAVIARYRHLFDQQFVLWETARVCAAS